MHPAPQFPKQNTHLRLPRQPILLRSNEITQYPTHLRTKISREIGDMSKTKREKRHPATDNNNSTINTNSSSSKHREEEEDGLIPGLPDDVALECLARVPCGYHRPLRHVCRRWRHVISSPEFCRRRRLAGTAEDLVFLVHPLVAAGEPKYAAAGTRHPAYGISVCNLTTGEWWRLALPPAWGAVPLFAQCAADGGSHVVVLGGWDPATLEAVADVRVLDLAAGDWRRGRPMPEARSFFAAAASAGGRVYVAGGHDAQKNALRSAAAYDIAADEWARLPDMAEERDEPQAVALAGGFLAASGYATESQGAFKRSAEWYDERGGVWKRKEEMLPATAAAETACVVAIGEKVWSVEPGKGGVREWESRGKGWRVVADGPPGMKACVKAVGVGDGDGHVLFVLGSVQSAAAEGKYAAWVMEIRNRLWRRLAVPPGFDGFVYSAAAVRL